jgi:hypothetical protein
VILLVLVVVLWIAVLAPSAWRRQSERRGAGSIDHFHHQLELLEHAGPKLVNPAYRLHTAVPGGGSFETSPPGIDTSRPKLVLLRPTDDEGMADVDDGEGCHYERVGTLSAPEPPERCTAPRAELAAYRRQQARMRCTLLLRGLVATVVVTAIIGAVPGLRLAWIFTGFTGLAALGLTALIGYAREVEATRRHRTMAPPTPSWAEDDLVFIDDELASSGYPGAWDDVDDYDLPQQAVASI